ncbi:HIRAN domain-containing protein [Sphingomonas hylomeconis]|uniref:HIRAN domain-containing protein n=1 Tax=Sphingomonas hylomeconis TaxID=1395958 RepID=A0ABV7SSM7_9SPHN|nr:HIRAN domain-containing protein [Sphingomonas hylomeconis]
MAFPNKRGPTRRFGISLCRPGDAIQLVREPKHPADENAIAVFGHDIQLGYVRSERAAFVARILDGGHEASAIFQEATQFGCVIRVAFDGEAPTLPPVRAAVRQVDGEFWPDAIYPEE